MILYPPLVLGVGLGLLVLTLTTMSLAGDLDQPKLPDPKSATTATPAAKPDTPAADRWSADEVTAAKLDCATLLQGLELDLTYLTPIKHGQCGTPQPVELRAFGANPRVTVDPPATLNCKMVATLAHWFTSTVQPLANTWLKSKVTTIRNAASYDCRNRVGDKSARLSEHAKANALDIMSFTTASGQTVTVSGGWGATLRELLQAPAAPAPAKVPPPAKADAASGFAATVTVAGSASDKPSAALTDPGAAAAKSRLGSVAIRQARLAEIARRGIPLPRPSTPEGFFIHAVHDTACNVFGTVLGPEANDAHKEHFHVDLTPRAGSSYCE